MDELGFKKIPDYSGSDFFDVISKRYEKVSSIITTNKSFEQWNDIFADIIFIICNFRQGGPSFDNF